jgi:copper chaperone
METITFKTNMKCSGCIDKITHSLNELVGSGHWKVDLQNPDKTLTVINEEIQEKDIIAALTNKGFTAEVIER